MQPVLVPRRSGRDNPILPEMMFVLEFRDLGQAITAMLVSAVEDRSSARRRGVGL